MKRSLRVFGVILGLIVVGALAVWTLALDRGIRASAPTTTVPPPSLITAPVEMRTLSEVIVVRGSVLAPATSPVLPPDLGGTLGVVTSLPMKVSDQVEMGDVVAAVSDRPVIVLEGKIPMYRRLRSGHRGPDVARLQEALASLGLYSDDVDGRFGWQTEAAVRALYKSSGYPPPTEDITVQPPSPETPSSEAPAADESTQTTRSVLSIPVGELVFFSDLPTEVALIPVNLGDVVSADSTVVGLGVGGAQIVADVPVDTVELLQVGDEAEILSEVLQIETAAKVVQITQESKVSSDGVQVQPVTLQPVGKVPGDLIGADVRVTFNAMVSDGAVLTVPISTIHTDADGRTFVTKVSGNGRREPIEVEVGAMAGGFVAVSSSDILPGDSLVVGIDDS